MIHFNLNLNSTGLFQESIRPETGKSLDTYPRACSGACEKSRMRN